MRIRESLLSGSVDSKAIQVAEIGPWPPPDPNPGLGEAACQDFEGPGHN